MLQFLWLIFILINHPDVDPNREGHDDDKGDDDTDDDDDAKNGGVGERITTSASSPSKYARPPVSIAMPVTKSQVQTLTFECFDQALNTYAIPFKNQWRRGLCF